MSRQHSCASHEDLSVESQCFADERFSLVSPFRITQDMNAQVVQTYGHTRMRIASTFRLIASDRQ
jgi:hypothetical protein